MEPNRPFALLITWTCYGTWLPGDARGYVSNTLLPQGGFQHKENRPGTTCTRDDPYTRDRARARMKQEPVYLSTVEAFIAAETIAQAALKRGWRIVRGAFMANHVHVLLQGCPDDGPQV